METFWLIRFKQAIRANTDVIGCLRFKGETTWEQRDKALSDWRLVHGRRALEGEESMWLDKVAVYDA